MWQRGELPTHQLPSGTASVDVPPTPQAVRPQKVAVSARVSSGANRTHLDKQAARVAAFGVVRAQGLACGSGVTDQHQRPQVLAVLVDTRISQVVVEHNARCARFSVA